MKGIVAEEVRMTSAIQAYMLCLLNPMTASRPASGSVAAQYLLYGFRLVPHDYIPRK